MWYLNVQQRKIMIPYSNTIGWVRTVLFVIGISSKVWLNHKCHCFLYKMRNENLPFIVTRTGNYLIFWPAMIYQSKYLKKLCHPNYLTFEMKSLILVQFKTYGNWDYEVLNRKTHKSTGIQTLQKSLHPPKSSYPGVKKL